MLIAIAHISQIDSLPPLSPDEAAETAAIASEKRRRETELSRRLVKKLLGRGVTVGHHPDGAPSAQGFDGCLTLSHSHGTAVAAYDDTAAIGVDIEFPSPALERVQPKFVNKGELGDNPSRETLLRAWTIKEAVFKAARTPGLSLLEIHIAPDMLSATARHAGGPGLSFGLELVSTAPMITVARRH